MTGTLLSTSHELINLTVLILILVLFLLLLDALRGALYIVTIL